MKLIIFDFDGTLADTTGVILATYRATIKQLGLPARSDEECRATIGLPLKEGFCALYPDCSEERLDLCVATYRSIFNEIKQTIKPRLFDGVKQTLKTLKEHGFVMSVASSRSHASLVEYCETCGIADMFSLILGADDVCRAKPDPEPVLCTLRKLGAKANDTVVVGDMPVDIAMGKGAGCTTVGVSYGNSSREELMEAGADYVSDRFAELLDLPLIG